MRSNSHPPTPVSPPVDGSGSHRPRPADGVAVPGAPEPVRAVRAAGPAGPWAATPVADAGRLAVPPGTGAVPGARGGDGWASPAAAVPGRPGARRSTSSARRARSGWGCGR